MVGRIDGERRVTKAFLNTMIDSELFAALARGDLAALELLYDRHSKMVFALAMHITGDRVRAEDLLHDTFLDLSRLSHDREARCGNVLRWLVVRLFELARQ